VLDLPTAGTLSEHLDETLSAEITAVTLDPRELAFMDSSGLKFLIELGDRARQLTAACRIGRGRRSALRR
jgi:anti-anti-sigma regulatory factor